MAGPHEQDSSLSLNLEQITRLLEHISHDQLIAVLDESGRFAWSSPSLRKRLGYRSNDLSKLSFADTVSAEDNGRSVDAFNHVRKHGKPKTVTTVFHDKSGHPIHLQQTFFSADEILSISGYLIALYQQVVDRKLEKTLTGPYCLALDCIGQQVVISDKTGTITYVNQPFLRETGLTIESVTGRNLLEILDAADNTAIEALNACLVSGETWKGNVTFCGASGRRYTTLVSFVPLRDASGEMEAFVVVRDNEADKQKLQERLIRLAQHDPVTGLPNRLLFSDRLSRKLVEAKRYSRRLAVLYVDLDRFKMVNDTLGREDGDILLRAVAEKMKDTLREVDTIARVGADEFTIILGELKAKDDAILVAKRVFEALSSPFPVSGHEIYTSAAVGISVFPNDGTDVEALVKNADAAMRRAKLNGRNSWQVYEKALNATVIERMTIENSLPKALERNEFVVYYQPSMDMQSGDICGTEALIRWRHPKMGLVSPGMFIPVAEESGLILPISELVLEKASTQASEWHASGLPGLHMAVNVSSRQFRQENYPESVVKTLAKANLAPEKLVIELTEYTLMQDPDCAISTLKELRSHGIRVALDDFGTGYSSLSYLKHFPLDILKIDRSFIRGVAQDPTDAAIAEAVISMAHCLNMRVIAEGVETLEQLNFLRQKGCDEVQGYFISQPVPAPDFEGLLCRSDLAA